MVDPTTVDETIQILRNIKHKYEEHHDVRYSEKAIEAAVKLSDRYITDRIFPIRRLMFWMKPDREFICPILKFQKKFWISKVKSKK